MGNQIVPIVGINTPPDSSFPLFQLLISETFDQILRAGHSHRYDDALSNIRFRQFTREKAQNSDD